MQVKFLAVPLFVLTICAIAHAQTTRPATTAAGIASTTSPSIDSRSRALFRIDAPNAHSVIVRLGYVYRPKFGPDGMWSVATLPLSPGFHPYEILIDGNDQSDPLDKLFFENGKPMCGLEVPAKTADFYDMKDVPHGNVATQTYIAKSADQPQRILIYTPPDYESDAQRRYPVLYLIAGEGENETAWARQGRAASILDNLIAAKAAQPMLMVMLSSSTIDPAALLAKIDGSYRTAADRDHRAIAGLSAGAMQALHIGLGNLNEFASIGAFSGAGEDGTPPGQVPININKSYGGIFADAQAFNHKVNLLWISVGNAEQSQLYNAILNFHQTLTKAGINHTFWESPSTAHDWQTWRRSLQCFAKLLFVTSPSTKQS